MKPKLIILLLIACANFAFAQSVPYNPDKNPYEYYNTGNYKEAAKLFKKRIYEGNKIFLPEDIDFLAKCYLKMNNVPQAKAVLQTAINDEHLSTEQKQLVRELADIYLKEKNYRKALELYQLLGTKWKKFKPTDINGFLINYNDALSESKCYEGLKLTDSATHVLTPYVFVNYAGLSWYLWTLEAKVITKQDSMHYDSMCVRYINLLKRSHSNQQLKNELKRADANFYFRVTWSKNYKDTVDIKNVSDTSLVYKRIKSGFTFYGTDAVCFETSAGSTKQSLLANLDREHPDWNEKYIQNVFRTSLLYKMISNLPDK